MGWGLGGVGGWGGVEGVILSVELLFWITPWSPFLQYMRCNLKKKKKIFVVYLSNYIWLQLCGEYVNVNM